MKKILKSCSVTLAGLVAASCAAQQPLDSHDHYESFNRKTYQFNKAVDTVVFKPIAYSYSKVVPSFVQNRVLNAYDNVYEVPTIANDLLQFRLIYALADTARLIMNSTVGIAGLFEVAEKVGLPKHKNDFGLTLAYWSAQPKRYGYFVVPFLGPNSFRGTIGIAVDSLFNPITYVKPAWTSYALYGGRLITKRAELLPSDKMVDEAFDPYVFVRSAYIQNQDVAVEDLALSYRDYQYKYLPPDVYNRAVAPIDKSKHNVGTTPQPNAPVRSLN